MESELLPYMNSILSMQLYKDVQMYSVNLHLAFADSIKFAMMQW